MYKRQVIRLGLVDGYGISLSDGLAFNIVFARGYHFICKEYRAAPSAKIDNFFLKTFCSTLIMLAVCFVVFFLLDQRLSMGSKSYAMIYCVAIGSIGGLVFLFSRFGKNGFRMLKNVRHHSRSKE